MQVFKTIPNYPAKKQGKHVFVSFPVEVTQAVIDYAIKHKLPCAGNLVIGQYVAAYIKERGSFLSKFAKSLSKNACISICNHHNFNNGYGKAKVSEVISAYEHNIKIEKMLMTDGPKKPAEGDLFYSIKDGGLFEHNGKRWETKTQHGFVGVDLAKGKDTSAECKVNSLGEITDIKVL